MDPARLRERARELRERARQASDPVIAEELRKMAEECDATADDLVSRVARAQAEP